MDDVIDYSADFFHIISSFSSCSSSMKVVFPPGTTIMARPLGMSRQLVVGSGKGMLVGLPG